MLEGYQEYDAIIGNMQSYLELPYKPTNKTKIVVEYTNNSSGKDTYGLLFGTNDGVKRMSFEAKAIIFGNIVNYNNINTLITKFKTGRQSVILDGNNYYYEFQHLYTWDYEDYEYNSNLFLFKIYSTSPALGEKNRVHTFKIAEDSTSDWLYDLVPAKRLSDGVGGWYNKVDDTFYPSSSNVDFTLGYPMFNMNNIKKLELIENYADRQGISETFYSYPIIMYSSEGSDTFTSRTYAGKIHKMVLETDSNTYTYIPCMRVSDNMFGFFELTKSVFYSGTAFTGGDIVESELLPEQYKECEWIKGDGSVNAIVRTGRYLIYEGLRHILIDFSYNNDILKNTNNILVGTYAGKKGLNIYIQEPSNLIVCQARGTTVQFPIYGGRHTFEVENKQTSLKMILDKDKATNLKRLAKEDGTIIWEA